MSIAEVRREGGGPARGRLTGHAATAAVAFGLILSMLTLLLGFVHPFVVEAGVSRGSDAAVPTDLYLVPVDGTGSRRLTTTPDLYEAHPDVAPDGRVAFARGETENFRLFTMASAGGDETALGSTSGHADGPVWRPGGQLSYWSDVAPAAVQPTPGGPAPAPGPSDNLAPAELSGLGIWTVSADGSGARTLSGRGGEGAESWAPDGSRGCGWSFASGSFDIATFDSATGAASVIVGGPSAEWGCSWSPDGHRVAFHSDRDGDFEIYSAAPDGSDVRKLTDDSGLDQLPRWSPDGTQIAYISSRTGGFEVYGANADGSGARNLTNDPALDDGFLGVAWLADGSGLVAASSGRPYATSAEVTEPLGVASLVLAAVILAAVLLLAWRFAPEAVGVLTIVGLVNGALLAFLVGAPLLALPVLSAGLAADIVAWRARRDAIEPGLLTAIVLAAASGFAFTTGYFALTWLTVGLGWGADLVIGGVLVATAMAAATAVVLAVPLRATESRIG